MKAREPVTLRGAVGWSAGGLNGNRRSGQYRPATEFGATTLKTGLERLLNEPELRRPLQGRRVALLAHPASVTETLVHAMDALAGAGRYAIVQTDLETNKRCRREVKIESMLRALTGCEAAMIANNNAAATLLVTPILPAQDEIYLEITRPGLRRVAVAAPPSTQASSSDFWPLGWKLTHVPSRLPSTNSPS